MCGADRHQGVLATATASSRDNGDVRKSPRVVGSRVSTPCASSPVTVRHAFSVVSVRWEMCELLRVAVSRAWSFGDSQRTVDFSPDPPPHSNKTLHSRVCCHTRLPTTFSDPHGGRSVIDHTSRGVPRDRLDHDDNTEDAPRSTHIHPPHPPFSTTDRHSFLIILIAVSSVYFAGRNHRQLESIHTASSTPPCRRPY